MLQILNFRMLRAFRENFGENFRRERPKIVHSRSRKTRMKPSKTGKPLPKSQLDFESFSLRPLRYISKYIFMANLRFVYRKSTLKLGTVAVRILLENASFRQALKPIWTSKLTFPRVIWRHPAKHPLGFRVVLVTTTSIHLHIHSYIIIAKSHRSVNTFCRRSPQRQRGPLVRDERKPLPPSAETDTLLFLSASGYLFHAVLSFPRARL